MPVAKEGKVGSEGHEGPLRLAGELDEFCGTSSSHVPRELLTLQNLRPHLKLCQLTASAVGLPFWRTLPRGHVPVCVLPGAGVWSHASVPLAPLSPQLQMTGSWVNPSQEGPTRVSAENGEQRPDGLMMVHSFSNEKL